MELLLLNTTTHMLFYNVLIYIPIWSYFYIVKSRKSIKNRVFTFQYGATSTWNNRIVKRREFKFTFQYGATSTKRCCVIDYDKLLFTFQYGATSTVEIVDILNSKSNLHSNMELLLLTIIFMLHSWINNLHSNMELLLPIIFIQPSSSIKIYIPIWSYFYDF